MMQRRSSFILVLLAFVMFALMSGGSGCGGGNDDPVPVVTPEEPEEPDLEPTPTTPITPTTPGTPTTPEAVDDADGDGLLDWEEEYFGTDPTLPDTDGDGVSDYMEIKRLRTDPNDPNDPDALKDKDGDGLSDLDEIARGTDPAKKDTDGDGLNDGDEVNTHNTNPLLFDTDRDGLGDGEEIELKLDPRNSGDADTLVEQDLKPSNIDERLLTLEQFLTPSLSASVAGSINRNFKIVPRRIDGFDKNRSKVGPIIEIQTEESDSATRTTSKKRDFGSGGYLELTFDGSEFLSVSGENATLSDLVICGFEDGNLTAYETVVKDNNISARIPKGGTYLVLDADNFLKGLGIDVSSGISTIKASRDAVCQGSNF
jgi:hypothetical protein